MPGKYIHILTIAAALGLAGFAARAEGIAYLEGNVYGPPALCAGLAQGGVPAEALRTQGGFVLADLASGPAFISVDFPGVCQIDGVVAGPLYGRGSDLGTSMVALSCIDDVAVPEFQLVVLEHEPTDSSGQGRVTVYPVGQPGEWASGVLGEYVTCEGEAGSLLEDLFLRDRGSGPG